MEDLICGNGIENPALMIIADYARKADAASGKALSGFYERKINEIFRESAQFDIRHTYKTCIIKHYLQGLGVGNWGSDKRLIDAWYEETEYSFMYYYMLLVDEIIEAKPTIILALGEYALRILCGKTGINKWRGSVLPLCDDLQQRISPIGPSIRVVVSLHPFALINDESTRFIMLMDYKKAVELIGQPERKIDYHEIRVAYTTNDYLQYRNLYPANPPKMVHDLETRFGFPTCLSTSYDGFRGICVPWVGSKVDLMERARMLFLVGKDLESKEVAKCNQNIGYDRRIDQRFGFYINPIKWDTMLAAHTIACEYPKRLDFLTSIYTDMSYYKDEGHEYDPRSQDIEVLYYYNVKDSITTMQIWKKQEEELKELEMLDFFNNFIMPLFHFYYDLESVGFKVDFRKRDELIAKYEGMLTLKLIDMKVIADKEMNYNSPSQIGKFLEESGFPVLRHRAQNSGYMIVNTDVESFKKMKVLHPSDYAKCKIPYNQAMRFIDGVLFIRRVEKILEYLDVGIHPWGRIHTSVNIGGTTSGRTSGGKCSDQGFIYVQDKGKTKLKLKNLGFSFQTVTKHGFIVEGNEEDDIDEFVIGADVRDMFLAEPGYVVVECDGAQAEARVCDLLAEDYDALEEYGKIDKHCKVASYVFTDFTYEEILKLSKGRNKTPEGEFMRYTGKQGKHAVNMGIGDFRFASRMNINIDESHSILKKIARAYPNIEDVFHRQTEQVLRSTRCMWNPFGRRRYFFRKIDNHYIKVAYSWQPQSIVSDNTKRAALEIFGKVDRTKVFPLAENHDSLTAMVKLGYLRTYFTIAKAAMEVPIDFRKNVMARDYDLVIPAEFSIGRKRWGQMRDIKKIK